MSVELPDFFRGLPAKTLFQFSNLGTFVSVTLEVKGLKLFTDARDVLENGGGGIRVRADDDAIILLGGGTSLLVSLPVGFLTFFAAVEYILAAIATTGAGIRTRIGRTPKRHFKNCR